MSIDKMKGCMNTWLLVRMYPMPSPNEKITSLRWPICTKIKNYMVHGFNRFKV